MLQGFLVGVVPLLVFFCRTTGSGNLLGRRWVEEFEAIECSERTLSRLDVRLNPGVTGVLPATATGICDGLKSKSPLNEEHNHRFNFPSTDLYSLSRRGEADRSSPDAERSPKDEFA